MANEKGVFVILDESEPRSFGFKIGNGEYKYKGVALEVSEDHAKLLLDLEHGNRADGSGLKWKLADESKPTPKPKPEPKAKS